MALVWKLLFLLVPPASLGGGWPCFLVAIAFIGCVTAVTGDIASLLGCAIGIPDEITAITLVALGTSLPDTFASRTAAQHDDTADNAVGNVTGSNSVNVFLGVGVSWTIGALYWRSAGVTNEWKAAQHPEGSFEDIYRPRYPEGGLMISTGTLVVSVLTYCSTAALCLGLLLFRRFRYGGELGGSFLAQRRDSGFLLILWCIFIVVTGLYALSQSR
jgi:solute carrier family 8 (sodium/calcium exchanger)